MKGKAINKIAPAHKVLARVGAASKRRGTDKLSAREIEAEITAYRKKKRQARPAFLKTGKKSAS